MKRPGGCQLARALRRELCEGAEIQHSFCCSSRRKPVPTQIAEQACIFFADFGEQSP
jgi:hypothetical protein